MGAAWAVLGVLVLYGLAASGVVSQRPFGVLVGAEGGCVALWLVGVRSYRLRPSKATAHVRVATQALAVTVTIYLLGWGPALAIAYGFAIVNNAFRIGSRSRWALVVWPVMTLVLGQVMAVAVGLRLRVSDATAGGLTAVDAVTLVLVALFVAQLAAGKEAAERKLAHAASHDPLTGLMNRAAFTRLLARRLAASTAVASSFWRATPQAAGGWRRAAVGSVPARVATSGPAASRGPAQASGGSWRQRGGDLRRDRRLPRRTQRGAAAAVLFGDLVGFKDVNDRFGHDAGDAVLAQVAARLASAVRHEDLLARFAGDEFVVGLCPVASPRDAVAAAERVLAVFDTPFVVAGTAICLGISVGIVYSATGRVRVEALLAEADAAMYEAKATRRSAWALLQVA